jgi:predicted dehydrogenase
LAESSLPDLGIGLVGYGFMGRAHSVAWTTVGQVFDLGVSPVRTAICGRDGNRAAEVARAFGWSAVETDWRALIAREDVQVVDICTPGSSHAEIAIAALQAGKHVLCEKPLGNTLAEAEQMAEAAREAAQRGQVAMVGFNYRRVPALTLARSLIAAGRIGQLHHVRASYLQDWLVDPEFPLAWRLQRDEAGSGALGDLGAHLIDIARFLTGDDFAAVCGMTKTFVPERPLPAEGISGLSGTGAGAARGAVSVDDAALFMARLQSGAVASFEATRFATGRKNAMRVEVNGDKGSVAFDLERLNELELFEREGEQAGFRRVLVTEPDDPYLSAWWPPGHVLGWEHTFVHELRDLVVGIRTGMPPHPDFDDGLAVQRVIDAVQRGGEGSSWVTLPV